MWLEVRASLGHPLSLSWGLGPSEMSALPESGTGSWGALWAITEACRGWAASSVKETGWCWLRTPWGIWAVSHRTAAT